MSGQDIATLVSTVGFPIVACIGLFWYMVSETRETRKVISENTNVLTKLTTMINHLMDELEGREDHDRSN